MVNTRNTVILLYPRNCVNRKILWLADSQNSYVCQPYNLMNIVSIWPWLFQYAPSSKLVEFSKITQCSPKVSRSHCTCCVSKRLYMELLSSHLSYRAATSTDQKSGLLGKRMTMMLFELLQLGNELGSLFRCQVGMKISKSIN